jgi:hypothetical protein
LNRNPVLRSRQSGLHPYKFIEDITGDKQSGRVAIGGSSACGRCGTSVNDGVDVSLCQRDFAFEAPVIIKYGLLKWHGEIEILGPDVNGERRTHERNLKVRNYVTLVLDFDGFHVHDEASLNCIHNDVSENSGSVSAAY